MSPLTIVVFQPLGSDGLDGTMATDGPSIGGLNSAVATNGTSGIADVLETKLGIANYTRIVLSGLLWYSHKTNGDNHKGGYDRNCSNGTMASAMLDQDDATSQLSVAPHFLLPLSWV